MMQLWVNLPRHDKKAKPGYQALKAEQFPSVALPGGGSVRVIAGEFHGARGPAHTFTAITMLDANLSIRPLRDELRRGDRAGHRRRGTREARPYPGVSRGP